MGIREKLLILLVISGLKFSLGDDENCEAKGFDLVKHWTSLYEHKFNETHKKYSDFEEFSNKLNEFQTKLGQLLKELETPIDLEVNRTMINIVNLFFDKIEEIQEMMKKSSLYMNQTEDMTVESNLKLVKINGTMDEIYIELEKLQNMLDNDAMVAHEEAFGKSENLDKDHEQLRDTIEELRNATTEYESQLKEFNSGSEGNRENIEKFSNFVDSVLATQVNLASELNQTLYFLDKNANAELTTISKLSNELNAKSNEIFESSLSLLTDVNYVKMMENIDEVENSIKIYKKDNAINVKSFDDYLVENEELFDSFLRNLDLAEKYQVRISKMKADLESMNHQITVIYKSVSESFREGQKTIDEVKNTYNRLTYFHENNEKSYEMATFALEKVHGVRKKLIDSQNIVASVEKGLEEAIRNAAEAKEKALEVKVEMDDLLREAAQLQNRSKISKELIDRLTAESKEFENSISRISNKTDEIEKAHEEHELEIKTTKEKVDQAKLEATQMDREIVKVLKRIQRISQEISSHKELDIHYLEKLEKRLDELESELEELQIQKRIDDMRNFKLAQEKSLSQYRSELKELEHEVETVKSIAESVDSLGCFKRQRLEPL